MQGLGKIGKEQTFAENVKTNGLGTLAQEVSGKPYDRKDVAGLEAMVIKDKFNKYNAPMEDSSDIIMDMVPAGLLGGIAAKLFGGKKVLSSAEEALAKSAIEKAGTAERTLGEDVSLALGQKASTTRGRYPEELMKYHAGAAEKLGYKNAEDMYNDFYNKFDVVDTYTDRAFAKLYDVPASKITNEDIVKHSMDSAIEDIMTNGKALPRGYQERKNMVLDRRSVPLEDRKRGINSPDDYADDFENIDDYDTYYGTDDDVEDIDDYDKYYDTPQTKNVYHNEEKIYKDMPVEDQAIIDRARERMFAELGSKLK